MKKSTIFFALFFCIFSSAQGYMPSLKSIFMDQNRHGSLPKKDFSYFIDWSKNNVLSFFMKNLQHSGGYDSNFNSLNLVTTKDLELEFINTGFLFKTDKDSKGNLSVTQTLANDTWKAQRVGFEFEELNPEKKLDLFLKIRSVLNLTKEQSLAHFINTYPNPKLDKISNVKQFIRDINSVYKSDFPESYMDDNSKTIRELFLDLNKHFKSDDANVLAFYTYLDPDGKGNIETVYQKINNYFKSFTNQPVEEIINDHFMPNGNIQFIDQNISMFLPNSLFYKLKSNDKSNINFKIREIQHNLEYDIIKNNYTFYIKLIPYSSTLSDDFKFVSRYDDILQGKNKISELSVSKNNFKDITFILTKDYITVSLAYMENNYAFNRKLKTTFKVK